MARVVFFPVGDINRASSRNRVHNVVGASKDFILGSKRNWQDADALVFQRAVTPRHLDFAKKGREAGKLIIFDISDFFFYRYKWGTGKEVGRMAKLAHCITTGNKDDKWLIESVWKKRTHMIPGAQKPSKHHRKHRKVAIPTIGWVGRENTMLKTLGTMWGVLERLTREGIRFRVLLINDAGNTHGLTLGGAGPSYRGRQSEPASRHLFLGGQIHGANEVVGRRWKLDTVDAVIAKCDLGIAPQVKQHNGRYHKDENKAYSFWKCGVPCVSFARTKDWYGDIKKLLIDWRFRERQGKRGIERAKAVAPDAVAPIWARVIDRELGKLSRK